MIDRSRRATAAMVTVAVLGCTVDPAAGGARQMRVFDFIDAVAGLASFSESAVARLLGKPLVPADGNEYFRNFELAGIGIDPALDAQRIELREPRPGSGATAALLTMQLTGGCTDLNAVRTRFPAMTLIDAPRGRSPDERTTFAVAIGGTAVRLGFDQATPACLRELTFERSA